MDISYNQADKPQHQGFSKAMQRQLGRRWVPRKIDSKHTERQSLCFLNTAPVLKIHKDKVFFVCQGLNKTSVSFLWSLANHIIEEAALAVYSVLRHKLKLQVTKTKGRAAAFPGHKVRGRPDTRRPDVLSLLLFSSHSSTGPLNRGDQQEKHNRTVDTKAERMVWSTEKRWTAKKTDKDESCSFGSNQKSSLCFGHISSVSQTQAIFNPTSSRSSHCFEAWCWKGLSSGFNLGSILKVMFSHQTQRCWRENRSVLPPIVTVWTVARAALSVCKPVIWNWA